MRLIKWLGLDPPLRFWVLVRRDDLTLVMPYAATSADWNDDAMDHAPAYEAFHRLSERL